MARVPEVPPADVATLTAALAPWAWGDVGAAVVPVGAAVVPVGPVLALGPVLADVVPVVPELGAIKNGAENVLGAVKSF